MKSIAILGFGVVGSGCAALIDENRDIIEKYVGDEIQIKYILDLRDKPESPYADRIIHDFNIILSDSDVALVIETIGGAHPAYDYTSAALSAKKHVVTSNKEVVSRFGDSLLGTAKANGVNYLFEASVGGGIPLLRTIASAISPVNRIEEISGILNGTTNYILTRMFRTGISFETALAEAQSKGYAERNPSADVDGIDAARKTSILAAITSGNLVSEEGIHTEGITAITEKDVEYADKLGYEIKLLGRVIYDKEKTYVYVAPHMVPNENKLSVVSDVYNAVCIKGNYIGDVMLYGRGAGAQATAAAVISDVANILSGKETSVNKVFSRHTDFPSDFSDFAIARYVRADRNTVFVLRQRVLPTEVLGDDALVLPKMTEREFTEITENLNIHNQIRII